MKNKPGAFGWWWGDHTKVRKLFGDKCGKMFFTLYWLDRENREIVLTSQHIKVKL